MATMIYSKSSRNATTKALKNREAICFDKDGVLVDISELTLHNRKKGFEYVGREFAYDADTLYKLGGIGDKYNGGLHPIVSILAFERWHKKNGGTAESMSNVFRKLITSQNASEKLDEITTMYQADGDLELARKIYWWDNGKFFTSDESASYVKPIEGSKTALLQIHEILRGNVAIVTNAPVRTAVIRDLLVAGFSESEISKLTIICDAKKPSPEKINSTLKNFGVNPTKAAYVGDATIDTMAARNAGVFSTMVLSGMGTLEVLRREKPDVILQNVKSLSEILRA